MHLNWVDILPIPIIDYNDFPESCLQRVSMGFNASQRLEMAQSFGHSATCLSVKTVNKIDGESQFTSNHELNG